MKKISALLISFLIMNCGSANKGVQETTTDIQTGKIGLRLLKEEVRKNPNDPQVLFRLGLAYAEMDSLDFAFTYYDSALYYNPSFARAMYERGNLLLKKNRIKEGYSQYLEVLQNDRGEDYSSEIAGRLGLPYPIHQLTKGDYNNAFGYYSPLGDRIVFQSDRDGNWEIYLMDEKGIQDVRLTHDLAHEEMPVFASDSKGIAFTSTREDSGHLDRVDMTRNIYYMDIVGNQQARIVESLFDDWYPAFTNKKNEIVFVSETDDPREINFDEKLSDIYLRDLNSGTTFRLTQNEADDGSPSVSRNGKWILFNSNRSGTFQIHRMDKKGTLVEQLTFLEGNCGGPHFSHNGKKIVFFAELNNNYDIYIMTATGQKLTKLTCHPAQDAYPCFSPDGKRIIFHSNRSGKFQIYWIDLMNPFNHEEVVKQLEKKIALLR